MSTPAAEPPVAAEPAPPARLAERVLGEMATAWQAQAEQFIREARAGLDRVADESAAGAAGPEPAWAALCRTLIECETRLAFVEARLREEASRTEALDRLVWPPAFQSGELARARTVIEQRLGDPASGAFELFLAVGRFNVALRSSDDLRAIAQALDGLGESAYRHWKQTGVNADDAAPGWQEELNNFLAARSLPLEISLALANTPFDLDCMQTADGGLGNRITVQEPLSWMVREKTETDSRVLVFARVIAC